MSKNTDQPKNNKNTDKESLTNQEEICGSLIETGLSEDGEFTQYIKPTPLRSKYVYNTPKP